MDIFENVAIYHCRAYNSSLEYASSTLANMASPSKRSSWPSLDKAGLDVKLSGEVFGGIWFVTGPLCGGESHNPDGAWPSLYDAELDERLCGEGSGGVRSIITGVHCEEVSHNPGGESCGDTLADDCVGEDLLAIC
jgi:hypothetical protein